MKSIKQYIFEKKASEQTLIKMIVNLKCLGKFGKAVQSLPLKSRQAAIDELISRGWLTDKLNLTSEGDKIVRQNLDLCQENLK